MNPKSQIRRTTPRSVKVAERLAEFAIRAGGFGTIFAVGLMMVFLFSVAWPLFRSAETIEEQTAAVPPGLPEVHHLGVDEEGHLAWMIEGEGRLRCLDLDSGETFLNLDAFPDAEVTALATPFVGETFTFGLSDGSLRKGKIGYKTEGVFEDAWPAGETPLKPGESRRIGETFFERAEAAGLRRTTFHHDLDEPFETELGAPVQFVDRLEAPTGEFFGLVGAGGEVQILRVREEENMLTGEVDREIKTSALNAALPARDVAPHWVFLGAGASQAYVVYPDGHCVFLSLSIFSKPELVQELELVKPGRALHGVQFLPGRTTLLVADTEGGLSSWFSVRNEEAGTVGLTRVLEYVTDGPALQALAFSSRSRMFLTGRADASLTVWQSTLGSVVHRLDVPAGESYRALAFHPRQDGVVALTDKGLHNWRVDFGYPESTLKSMFAPIWYEGYSQPSHVWQSSASSDDFEPKMGMWPLVFGTLKATLFAMLFGAPIAVLAALFTSEYMHARLRASTKTLVELLAGLPSVVLGFLAALVVAPYVQQHLSVVLSGFFLTPLVLLLGAHLWQLQPTVKRRKRSGLVRTLSILACIPLVGLLAVGVGPVVEKLLFAGDSLAWLDHRVGTAASGWFFLMLPLSAALVLILFTLRRSLDPSPMTSLLRFFAGVALTLVVAAGLAFLLQAIGFDPRGGIIDTYEQRNALVVGIAVGLVVLPLVYTLTEDALGEVPQNLREASLGAGATPWQTAVRVVLPFATSGIFSALMVGLGRAVGETMIVLMAAGNTPLTEWNVFNGFRTLAANIATEIPEAVVGSAHYRALFFTALLLFAMTFVINTLAELVRRHFRGKVRAL